MFKKQMMMSEFRALLPQTLKELKGEDAIQILHRGECIKVVITQEFFLELINARVMLEIAQKVGQGEKLTLSEGSREMNRDLFFAEMHEKAKKLGV